MHTTEMNIKNEAHGPASVQAFEKRLGRGKRRGKEAVCAQQSADRLQHVWIIVNDSNDVLRSVSQ
jgi:hypothetical protein